MQREGRGTHVGWAHQPLQHQCLAGSGRTGLLERECLVAFGLRRLARPAVLRTIIHGAVINDRSDCWATSCGDRIFSTQSQHGVSLSRDRLRRGPGGRQASGCVALELHADRDRRQSDRRPHRFRRTRCRSGTGAVSSSFAPARFIDAGSWTEASFRDGG